MQIRLVHITTVPVSLAFLRGQVGFMKARGLHVHAISSPGSELDSFGEREGVNTSGVEMPRRITPARDIAAVINILRELRRVRPTIVHAHTPKGGLLGMIAAWLYGVRIRIYHLRGLPLTGATGLKRRLLWGTEWVSCRLAHQVFCVSHSVRQEAVSARICPPDRIKVLLGGSGNGVDATETFNPAKADRTVGAATRCRLGIPRDALVIGFVGRVVRDKGIVELGEAWRELREIYPSLHLLLVGPFEPQDPVPRETEALLRADARVHLTGMNWDTPSFYAAMDVVALPTYREGFPNVPLEAAAMCLPVVATDIPGCLDAVLAGETGLLVPPRDARALREALGRYLNDPDMRRSHGQAARTRVLRDFRPEGIWAALHSEYLRLLDARHQIKRERAPAEAVA